MALFKGDVLIAGTNPSSSGDMRVSVYDTNNNGIVDNAETVNNHTVQSDVPSNAVFTDTTYTAGTGIAINNGVISNTQTSAEWGNITGTLSNQTDLQTALNNIEDDIDDLQVTAVTTQSTDLDDYLEQGQYYFGADYIPTNIPAGVNGWLVVIPSGDENVPQVKQIWYRMGTPGSNDYETYERTKGGNSNWGPWKLISVDIRPTGEVNTAVGSGNLIIKKASQSADSTPNNGVVLEFGNSANWTGQLYIGDNATQGIYYNGWSNGTRGSWKRLADVPTKTTDANGWTVLQHNGYTEYYKKGTMNISYSSGPSWSNLTATALPTGMTRNTANIYFSGVTSRNDSALTTVIGISDANDNVVVANYWHYGGSINRTITWWAKITKID